MAASVVLMIGNFDGVHLGHAALVRRARAMADESGPRGRVIALAFDPHPMTSLRPELAPERVMTFERRAELLRGLGADEVGRLTPSHELLGHSPEAFIDLLVERYQPSGVVEGQDFRFGRARSGDAAALERLCAARGMRAVIVPPVTVALSDQTIVTASSTMARWLLRHGRVSDAALVLGRPHEVSGTVVQGDRRGRLLGFPTANLMTDDLIPADAVYAGIAELPGGRERAAAIHVGARATFNNPERTVEAFILGWDGPVAEGGAEYGWPLRLRFTAWLRDQAKFDSVDHLINQIRRDVGRVEDCAAALDRGGGGRRGVPREAMA